jgi:hypothetical protein
VSAEQPAIEQLALEVPDPQVRRYWECVAPKDWQPVTVRVRYGDTAGMPHPPFPLVRTRKSAPRNVLVERADGTLDVKYVRHLRVKRPR